MPTEENGTMLPDRRLAAVCGLFCPACSAYIGAHGDPERLRRSAERARRPVEELECEGCRAEKRSFFCRELCRMAGCAAQKGVEFCGQCPEYPCADLKDFQARAPHRLELWKSQERIRKAGWEKWYAEMRERFSCPACGTLNSAYDLECRKCGHVPGSAFAAAHRAEVTAWLSRQG